MCFENKETSASLLFDGAMGHRWGCEPVGAKEISPRQASAASLNNLGFSRSVFSQHHLEMVHAGF
jgi:hypothetical protein